MAFDDLCYLHAFNVSTTVKTAGKSDKNTNITVNSFQCCERSKKVFCFFIE